MRLGSLFSGGGLGDFGYLAAGFDIRYQVEINDYCQRILCLRYPDTVKYQDIKKLNGAELEKIDILTGGFPCQPFSYAGQRKGEGDDRNLWPEMLRIIRETRPRWVVAENVPGLINIYIDRVLSDLEAEGYTCWPFVFSAHALGAPHRRDRIWIVAYAGHDAGAATDGLKQKMRAHEFGAGRSRDVADSHVPRERWQSRQKEIKKDASCNSNAEGLSLSGQTREQELSKKIRSGLDDRSPFGSWWEVEPAVGRVAHGCANRVERLRMLGNGQVAACTYAIGTVIMEVENGR